LKLRQLVRNFTAVRRLLNEFGGPRPRKATVTVNVRFGICGINHFNKLVLSRKPSAHSDPQRLFGAVSRKTNPMTALFPIHASKSAI
jgi:hypothetical protein